MDAKSLNLFRYRKSDIDTLRDTPARNWRERRQKARVIAASYRPRKPKPVWDAPF